jgi:hypothetical protein
MSERLTINNSATFTVDGTPDIGNGKFTDLHMVGFGTYRVTITGMKALSPREPIYYFTGTCKKIDPKKGWSESFEVWGNIDLYNMRGYYPMDLL